MLLKVLAGLVLLMVIGVATALYLLRDANRFKPELEEIIHAQTGVPVKIEGDLSWAFFPPISLTAEAISADYEGTRYSLERLAVDVDLMTAITSGDINQWQVDAFAVDNLEMTTDGDVTHLESLRVHDFAPDAASPFTAELTHTAAGEPEVPLSVDGNIVYHLEGNQIDVLDTHFATTDASGTCDATTTLLDTETTEDPPDALIPVSMWRGFNWDRILRARSSHHARGELCGRHAESAEHWR